MEPLFRSRARGSAAALAAIALAVAGIAAAKPAHTAGDGPRILSSGLLGPAAAVNGVVLRFDSVMNEESARAVGSYLLRVRRSGKRFTDIPFTETLYDPEALVLKLKLAEPLDPASIREAVIVANGDAILDFDGVPLDGDDDGAPGGMAALRYAITRGRSLTVKELDGDSVNLNVRAPAQLVAARRVDGGPVQFWLKGAGVGGAVLKGRVRKGRTGNGKAVIQEISGTKGANLDAVINDLNFVVQRVTPGDADPIQSRCGCL